MSLVGSATIRKIAQSFRVCSALRRASSARTCSAGAVAASRDAGALALALVLLGAVVPCGAFAQSEARRPVRQVESDDGVIEITNSHEAVADPTSADETTSVRALRAVDARGEPREKRARELSALEPSASATQPAMTPSSSWWLPLIVVAVAGGTCVWGVRRRNSSRASSEPTSLPGRSDAPGRIDASNEASAGLADDVLDADVIDEPAPFVVPAGQLAAPPGQWGDAVRDSVPPSSSPRSSRGANAPRQWLSQALRIKSDES